jgi:hypothetical protein
MPIIATAVTAEFATFMYFWLDSQIVARFFPGTNQIFAFC